MALCLITHTTHLDAEVKNTTDGVGQRKGRKVTGNEVNCIGSPHTASQEERRHAVQRDKQLQGFR